MHYFIVKHYSILRYQKIPGNAREIWLIHNKSLHVVKLLIYIHILSHLKGGFPKYMQFYVNIYKTGQKENAES